jgi:hypothetical protein
MNCAAVAASSIAKRSDTPVETLLVNPTLKLDRLTIFVCKPTLTLLMAIFWRITEVPRLVESVDAVF